MTAYRSKSPVDGVSGAHWIELANGRSVVFTKQKCIRTRASLHSRTHPSTFRKMAQSAQNLFKSSSSDSEKKQVKRSGTSTVANTARSSAVLTITPLFLGIFFLTGSCTAKNRSDGTPHQNYKSSGPLDSQPSQT